MQAVAVVMEIVVRIVAVAVTMETVAMEVAAEEVMEIAVANNKNHLLLFIYRVAIKFDTSLQYFVVKL